MIAHEGSKLRKCLAGVLVATTLSLAEGTALAADRALCDAYVRASNQAYWDVRHLACGFDLNDPKWKWPPDQDSNYLRFCLGASDDTVNDIMNIDLDLTVGRCEKCRAYAKLAAQAANDNIIYHCGFSGPRWDTNEQDHFNWCMQAQYNIDYGLNFVGAIAGKSDQGLWDFYTYPLLVQPETGAREQAIEQCKLTHQPSCLASACHAPSAASRTLSVPASLPRGRPREVLPSRLPGGSIISPGDNSENKSFQSSTSKAYTPVVRKPTIVGPGLLEGDDNFGRQGVGAAKGAPRTPAPRAPNTVNTAPYP